MSPNKTPYIKSMKGINGNKNVCYPMSTAPKEKHSKDWARVFSDCTSSQNSVSKMNMEEDVVKL